MSDVLVKMLRGRCNCNMLSTPCGSEDECRFDFRVADRIEELEAKLAKALKALQKLDRRQDCLETFDAVVDEIVTTTLAELKGETDE